MEALADRLNVVSSSKITPSVAFGAVRSTSPLRIGSLTFSAIEALPRVTVALPWTLATLPISSAADGAAGGAGVCARACTGNAAINPAKAARKILDRTTNRPSSMSQSNIRASAGNVAALRHETQLGRVLIK